MSYNLKYYCKDYENIENYEKALKDNFKGWECHHKLETHNSDGERRLVDISRKELIALDMYWHRPASELIFLTISEHISLHNKGNKHFLGKHHSEETRNKLAKAKKGKYTGENSSFYGKHHSEEAKKRIGAANKLKPSNVKGTCWFNNGEINIRAKECPPGFIPGRLRK